MRVGAVVLILILTFTVSDILAQEAKKAEPASETPQLSLADHDRMADVERQGFEIQLKMNTIEKKYQQQLDNDPEYQQLKNQARDLNQEAQREFNVLQSKVDAKKWRFDAEKLEYIPVPQPPARTK